MECVKIHRLETIIILQITQARLLASFQEGEPMKDQKTDPETDSSSRAH